MLAFLQQIVHAYAWRIARWGLPLPMAGILLESRCHPDDAEPARLAEFAQIPRQTMTTMLDSMERNGLLRRTPHPADRRRKLVRLTPDGERLADEIFADVVQFERRALDVVSPGQLPEVRRLLESYTAMLNELNRTSPPSPTTRPLARPHRRTPK
jgi:DNA-binding MarR family transcriptional regulator